MSAPDAASVLARVEIRVSGRVQGVGYRDFARRCAERGALAGYAMNLDDGAVRVVAEGPRALLEALIAELRRGPRLARVDELDVEWALPRSEFSNFSIRHGGRDA